MSASGCAASRRARTSRRVLCISPRYQHSFGTFDHAFRTAGVRAFMPPQGLLVIAAYLPPDWDVRFVDENVRRVSRRDLRWADAVLLSGMHVQRDHILELAARAHAEGKLTVLGGPSVSGCPEWYAGVDLLHEHSLELEIVQIVEVGPRAAGVARRPLTRQVLAVGGDGAVHVELG